MRRVILLGLGLALPLAACGTPPDGDRVASLTGGRATTTTTAGANATDKDPQQQAIEFARCMRQHGVDMPDPEVDDQGRVKVRIGPAGGNGRRPDPSKLDEAQKACGSLLGGGDGPGQIDPAARDAMVSFARCMREHGIDMPDPTGDGLVMRKDTGGGGPDPESEAFQRAERACEHHLAGLGRPARQSGGRP
jgi:hypothetical protein